MRRRPRGPFCRPPEVPPHRMQDLVACYSALVGAHLPPAARILGRRGRLGSLGVLLP